MSDAPFPVAPFSVAPFPVALVQSVICGDIGANVTHILEQMRVAAKGGARLVHFPECVLSGYPKGQVRNWREVDWFAVRSGLQAIARCARRLGVWAVIGCAHRLSEPNRPHNSMYVISDEGALVGRYDKRMCSHTEISDWFSPGFEALVFDVDGMRFGCCLCIEIQFPELFAAYERSGVDCVLLSSYSDDPSWRIKAQALAGFNCIWISHAVPACCSRRLPTSLIGPDGAVLAQGDASGAADVVFGRLDRAAPEFDVALTKARPWRRLAREGGIYAARRVDDPRSAERLVF